MKGSVTTPVNVDRAERSFAPGVYPLSTEGPAKNLTLLRVHADLLGSNGASAISEAVIVDLLVDLDCDTKAENTIDFQGYLVSPSHWLSTIYSGHTVNNLVQLSRIFFLPISLAAVIGLAAWLFGYVLGKLLESFFAYLCTHKKQRYQKRWADVENVRL